MGKMPPHKNYSIIVFQLVLTFFVVKIHASLIGTQFSDPGPHFRDVVELRNRGFFVDKSLLIEHILSAREHMVIEAPAGFGKTINLRMLKEFLELEVDIDGKAVEDVNSTKNFAIFSNPPLKIVEKAPQIFKDFFAQWPVLYVNLDTLSVSTFKDFDESFRRLVAEMFAGHEYLTRSTKLSGMAKDDFELYRDLCPDLNIKEVALGGEKLSWLLREHHQHNVIVLIDNYDAPIRKAILTACPALDIKGFDQIYETVFLFIARLVKGNLNVARSVLTGRLRVVGTNNWEPDNLAHYSVLDDENLWRYYGLTDEEVHSLGVHLKEKTKWEVSYDDVKAWYGGYRTVMPNQKLYNTLSTMTYLKTQQLKRYLIEAENLRPNLTNLLPYERLGKSLEEAFDEQTRITPVKLGQRDLVELRTMVTVPGYKLNREMLLQYLAESGLYTLDSERLTIPNLESDTDLKALVLTRDYFKAKFGIHDEQINNYIGALDELALTEGGLRNLVAAVLGLFVSRLPASSRELLHALIYLAADTKFPLICSEERFDRSRRDLFVKRYDSTGIVIGVEIGNGTAYSAVKRLVDLKAYEVFKNHSLEHGILIGLFINEERECTLSYPTDTRTFSLVGHRNFTLQGRNKNGSGKDWKNWKG